MDNKGITTGNARSTTPIGLNDFDTATLALERAAAIINTVSGAYDVELDVFMPRNSDIWLTMLTALPDKPRPLQLGHRPMGLSPAGKSRGAM